MKKLLSLLLILTVSISFYAKDYVSDKQYYILKNSTEKIESNLGERLITIDESDNKAIIQVLSGKTITRTLQFVDEKVIEQGSEYDGYYTTSQGEKIIIGEDQIIFESNRTLGAVFFYEIKK